MVCRGIQKDNGMLSETDLVGDGDGENWGAGLTLKAVSERKGEGDKG